MSPVNTSYLNVGKSIAFPSMFTVAVTSTAVAAAGQAESSFSVPARLLPLGTGNLALRANDLFFVGPPSAVSSGLAWNAYGAPTTNTVTLRFVNATASVVTLAAGTWAIAYVGVMP